MDRELARDEAENEASCKVSEPYEDALGRTWIHIIVVSTKPPGAMVRWTGRSGIVAECAEGGEIEILAERLFADPELRIRVIAAIEE